MQMIKLHILVKRKKKVKMFCSEFGTNQEDVSIHMMCLEQKVSQL